MGTEQEDINSLASDLLASALDDPDDLNTEEIEAIRAGIRRGLEAAKVGRERPLSAYVADVERCRAEAAQAG